MLALAITNKAKHQVASSAELPTKVIYQVHATAYSSSPEETDSTPFITATGAFVHDGIIAANFLPFGTRVRIPSLFGNKIFVVEDRMNARLVNSIDIWMPTKTAALQFGAVNTKIEVLDSNIALK
jgi:3D (Asp-Asp-Asp) domain-containing protein